ncbi:MAG: DegT/DnrJ/EryC1/StrS family aminotransferase [Candidatus Binatia bacterium]
MCAQIVLDAAVLASAVAGPKRPANPASRLLAALATGPHEGWVCEHDLHRLVALIRERMEATGEGRDDRRAARLAAQAVAGLGVLPTSAGGSLEILRSEPPDFDRSVLLRVARSWLDEPMVVCADGNGPPSGSTQLTPEQALLQIAEAEQGASAIPFVDLAAQGRRLRAALQERMDRVLQSGRYVGGEEILELENTLGSFVGVSHAIACSSGTDALVLGLRAVGVGRGDAVFVPSFTFAATAEAVSLVSATPVFVDVDPRTYNIDPASLERAVETVATTKPDLRPRAVIAVDLFGLCADYDAVSVLCKRRGLVLIEDAAQAFGASLGGRRAGSYGLVATTSFFPAKPLGAYGDGGMLFTDDDDTAAALRSLRSHGEGASRNDNLFVGTTARLDALQAAVLLAKWELFEEELTARRHVARRYSETLKERIGDAVITPRVAGCEESAWAQYTIRLPAADREGARKLMSADGVPTAVYYPKGLHHQPAFANEALCPVSLSATETASTEVLSLPFGPYLKRADQDRVVDSLVSALRAQD